MVFHPALVLEWFHGEAQTFERGMLPDECTQGLGVDILLCLYLYRSDITFICTKHREREEV